MAGNSVIGALRIVLGLDSASLETGLKKSQSSLASFAKSAAFAGTAIAASFTAALVGIGVSIKGAIDEAAKMSKLAQSVGVPIEQLTALKFAAQLSGIEIETLAKSMGILSKNMAAAAGGVGEMDIKGGKAAGAFKALGIDVMNSGGQLKTSTEIMTEVARKFEGMKDGAGKTALAMAIFGKSGAALIPMLNKGAAGFKENMEEAEKLGLVLDGGTGQAAVQFNNTLQHMQKTKEGMWIVIAEKLLPAFQTFANILLEARQNSGLMSAAADQIVTSIRGVVSAAIVSVTALFNMGRAMIALKTLAVELLAANVFNPAEFAAAFDKFTAVMDANTARMAAAMNVVKKVWQDVNTQFQNSALADPPLAKGLEKTKNALESFLISQAKHLAGLQAEVATFGMAAGARERAKLQMEALSIATENHLKITDAQRQKIIELAAAFEQMKIKLEGLKLIEEVQPAWLKLNIELDRAAQALAAAGASAATVQAVFMKIQFPSLAKAIEEATNLKSRIDSLVTSSIDSLANSLANIVTGTESAAEAFKKFATSVISDLVKMIIKAQLYQLIASAFGFASPMGKLGGVGGDPWAGVRIPGFAQGGAFNVGGSGGIDSQLVMFKATPGEHVNVGNDNGPGARAGSMNLTVVVQGSGDKDLMEKMRVGATTVVKQALGAYDKNLPTRVHQIAGAPRDR